MTHSFPTRRPSDLKGAESFSRLMPCTPPVKPSKWLYFSSCGVATDSAKVASARYSPLNRRAGKPNRKPTPKPASPAIGKIGRAHVLTPVNNAHRGCLLRLDITKQCRHSRTPHT